MQSYQELLGETFDQMTEIGSGGGGTVFRARHKRLDKEVVLKKIHTNQLKTINRRAELDILKNLKHNYIPQIFDFIEYGDAVYTVMEYIPGQSFAQLLRQNIKFSQKDVVKWMRQLCEVVEYLHSRKQPIIHCDIKPANVMLTPQGDICLIDFNISGVKTEEGIASIGYSDGYAPVEQFAVVAERNGKSVQKRKEQRSGITPVQAANTHGNEGMELPEGNGTNDPTEMLSGNGGNDPTEMLSGNGGYDPTEMLSGNGTEGSGKGPSEIGGGDGSRTWEKPVTAQTTSTSAMAANTKSRIRSMSDEDWAAARQVVACVGGNLMIDERTDIYSIGATLYHILCGTKPQPFYRQQIPIGQLVENISGSVAYVIEKAMALKPEDRFKNSEQLLKTVRNLGTVDKRYKALSRRQLTAALVTGVLTVASAFSVSFGISTMAQEKKTLYASYMEEMETARAAGDYDQVEMSFEKAVALMEGEEEAYFEKAMSLYEQRRYEEAIDFLSRNVYTNPAMSLEEGYGRFYFITASCYFELEDYNAAISYYERAVIRQSYEMAYYRDYVVALARNGQIEEAEQVLQEAAEKGISADVMSLLNGEIALLRNDYEKCQTDLRECIEDTKDDYIMLRAYSKLDEAYQQVYQGAEQLDVRMELLTQAVEALPAEYQITLMERLAQVYIDYSDLGDRDYYCEKAIGLFLQMEERGYATFTARYNVAVLYEKMGRYEESMAQLNAMTDSYPDHYALYKRMAYVELGVQAAKPNEERDYHTFEGYYDKAAELYKNRREGEDMEMLSLQELYNDVVANGWL